MFVALFRAFVALFGAFVVLFGVFVALFGAFITILCYLLQAYQVYFHLKNKSQANSVDVN